MSYRSRVIWRAAAALLLAVALGACSSDDGAGGSRVDPIDAVPIDATIALPGLAAAGDVVFDTLGVPHIYAPTRGAAIFLQGYETAKARFWELDAFRRVATGRLSEIFGAITLGMDAEMRTIFLARDGRHIEDALWERLQAEDPASTALIEAYAAGINAWLDDLRNERNSAAMPAEYSLVGADVGDLVNWTPTDTLAIGRLQAWNLSYDAGGEVGRAERLAALPQPLYDDVFRSAPATPATILPVGADGAAARALERSRLLAHLPPLPVLARVRAALEALAAANPVTQGDEQVGSNNWVVAPSRSASGHALLANDPHLAHFNPLIWHMLQLETDDGYMANGVNFPGLPGVILGHNRRGAWGATTSNIDVTDVYVETVTTPDDYPASPRTVLFKGEQVPVRRQIERIRMSDGSVFPLVVEIVPHHGPMMPDPDLDDDVVGLAATGMSVRWTGHEVTLDSTFLRLLTEAANVDDFQAALRFFAVGGQNWVWADIDGDIAYSANVLIPQRPAGTVPFLPLPGSGEAEWLSDAAGNTLWLPEERIPHAVNPAEGYLASSNNDHNGNTLDNDPLNDAVYLDYDNAPGFRQQRILDLLSNDAGVRPGDAKMTMADMSDYQYDNVSLEAARLVPFLFQAADARPDLVDATMGEALDRLRTWGEDKDGSAAWDMPAGVDPAALRDDLTPRAVPVSDEERADAVAASIYAGWTTRLSRAVLADDFAGTGIGVPGGDDAIKALLHILEDLDRSDPGFVVHTKGADGQSTLWDDKTTPEVVETRDEILLAALRAGLSFLAEKFATADQSQWLWGLIHQVRFQHFFGQAGLPLFDLGDFAAAGGRNTVNPGGYSLNSDSFNFTGGPSMRFVAELDPDGIRAVNVLPGGNFGNPGPLTTEVYNHINPQIHYGDQTASYLNGQVYELRVTRQQVADNAESRIHYDAAAPDSGAIAAYQDPGPYPVGVRTLRLGDRDVEVWYPAVPGSEEGLPRASYNTLEPLPAAIVDALRQQFPDLVADIEMTAYRDLPASDDGPFPLMLFSHGFGGFRQANSRICAGVASWGFVVASPDHLERGLGAVSGLPGPDPERSDREVLLSTIDLIAGENLNGFLSGRVDLEHIAATGHSAGGGAALDLLDAPQIGAVVGYAAAGAPDPPQQKPTLLMVAAGDIAVTPAASRDTFDELAAPKRLVVLDQLGHNSYTDSCPSIRELGGLASLPLPIPPQLIRLGDNGCTPLDFPAERSWAIMQHFTVAHLRDAFGLDPEPLGLGPGIAYVFPIAVDYTAVASE
jgi:penicillin amidase